MAAADHVPFGLIPTRSVMVLQIKHPGKNSMAKEALPCRSHHFVLFSDCSERKF